MMPALEINVVRVRRENLEEVAIAPGQIDFL